MRIPSATYRVQFNLNFRFADAQALVPYLHDLGISDLYASPRFKARKGSSHGYDVADPMRINSELGTEEEFDRLVARLHQYGMGLLLDIVPNHMAASQENPWWMDVLENGRESPYAVFFDIDWQPRGIKIAELERGRVVIPILAEPYAEVLRKRAIRLRFDDRGFSFQYEDHCLPLNASHYSEVLHACASTSADAAPLFDKLDELCRASPGTEHGNDPPTNLGRNQMPEIKAKLWHLYQHDDAIHQAIEDGLRIYNGNHVDSASLDLLHGLLSRQAYRLTHWRLAPFEINYRRFFDINDLVGLRTEDPLVFSARHSSLMRLLQEGKVSGLRIDHIDGLRDPLEYLHRLNAVPVSPAQQPEQGSSNVYTVVEKITCGHERLPPEWPVMGTTGYDFLNASNALFIDPEGYLEIEESYRKFAAIDESFGDEWHRSKMQAIDSIFAADLDLLAYRLGGIAALDPDGADIPVQELTAGLKEITACLPVYRTYYREDSTLSEQDKSALESAISDAQQRFPERVSARTFSFLQKVFCADLALENPGIRAAWLSFISRWQQFTGAVMAKGLEDTALFSHHSLISINEVGNNPFHEQICFERDAFHKFNCETSRNHPHTMNASSTHDTKWSEDVRARINVLSEMPREWSKCLRRWSRMNRRHKTVVDRRFVPSPNEEVLFYQAMLGIWPLDPFERIDRDALRSRLEEFLIKAAKEAKTDTSWLSPNEKHESALRSFVSSLMAVPHNDTFILDFLKLLGEVAFLGVWNSCSQLILKITAPGVPDFYQGNELWNPCLTDPDNRQNVDFRTRIAALEELRGARIGSDACCSELLNNWPDGRLKLFLTVSLLNFRRSHHQLFSDGSYIPLATRGTYEQSIFAFARAFQDEWLVVAVPRLLRHIIQSREFPLGEAWHTTSIELSEFLSSEWAYEVLTGAQIHLQNGQGPSTLPASQLFLHFPFAVLSSSHPG